MPAPECVGNMKFAPTVLLDLLSVMKLIRPERGNTARGLAWRRRFSNYPSKCEQPVDTNISHVVALHVGQPPIYGRNFRVLPAPEARW